MPIIPNYSSVRTYVSRNSQQVENEKKTIFFSFFFRNVYGTVPYVRYDLQFIFFK